MSTFTMSIATGWRLKVVAPAVIVWTHAQTPEQILARWSVQRGVPFSIDAGASDAVVEACAASHDFRLLNAQKVAIDAMEPPPREGGVRFVSPPAGVDFTFDDPFLGGVQRRRPSPGPDPRSRGCGGRRLDLGEPVARREA